MFTDQRRWTWTGDFKCRVVKTGFYRNRSMQTGSSGTLIGWKSGQTTFVPLWDWMEGAWLRTQCNFHVHTVFSLYTASLRPSIFRRKFVLICIVLSNLSVNTVHHTLQYTLVYGTHSGWCWSERSKVARELEHKSWVQETLAKRGPK